MGGLGEIGSGDLFVAFSMQPVRVPEDSAAAAVRALDDDRIDAILAADAMLGVDGITIPAPPRADRLRAIVRKHWRNPT